MLLFQWLVPLLIGAVALTALARRLGLPYPAFLAVGGAGVALLPVGPPFVLEPDLALAVFVAPILLNEAYDASLRDLRRHWLPISCLVLAAVALTTVLVTLAARLMLPDLSVAAAVALGAIVAPPDATAATAVLKSVRLPLRITTILEGESLLNDASALFIYRLAVGAATMQAFHPLSLVTAFVLVLPLSLLAGVVLGAVVSRLIAATEDTASSIVLQFAATFAVWLLAEKLQLSPVLTIVAYAVTVARRPRRLAARLRLPSYAVWDTACFMLNVLAFVLIGLQLRPILDGMRREELAFSFGFAAAILGVCIGARLAWVLGYYAVLSRRIARVGWEPTGGAGARPTVRSGMVVGWCGMRGIVTLAAAFALPVTGFPHRELMQLTAFTVVLGTLVLQGLTLKPLLRWARLEDDGQVDQEIGRARATVMQAALAALDGEPGAAAEALRAEYAQLVAAAAHHPEGHAPAFTEQDALRLKAIDAARDALHRLREQGAIGNGAFARIEVELDQAELHAHET